MRWEYRVIEKPTIKEPVFVLHEVYYDEDGLIKGWTQASMKPVGLGSLEDLKGDLENMMKATGLPVIKEENLTVGRKRI